MTSDARIKHDVQNSQARITELESLRGLAALLIVFFHIPRWNPLLDVGLINNGYLMVDLFFVLSGFVIFNAYAENINSRKDLLRFQFLRFGRLYPVHLTFIGVFLLIELAKYIAQVKLNIVSPNTQPFRENNLTALIQQIFMVQAIGPTGNYLSFNGVAWSISVEFYTYIIFGLIVLFFKNSKVLVFALMAVLSIMLLAASETFGFESLLHCLAGFSIGCLTAMATKGKRASLPTYVPILLFAGILVYLQVKTIREYDLAIYALTACLIASLVLSKGGLLKKLLNLKLLTWLGTISYSVYMSHQAILWVTNQFIRVVLKKPEAIGGVGLSIPQVSQVEMIVICLAVLAAVLLVSTFSYHFIEKPMRMKSRKIAKKLFSESAT